MVRLRLFLLIVALLSPLPTAWAASRKVDSAPRNLFEAIDKGFDSYNFVARPGGPEKVREFVDGGADLHARDRAGRTPYLLAASKGDAATMRLLAERGARKDVVDTDGNSALDLALQGNRGPAVKLLVEEGWPLSSKQKFHYFCYRIARFSGWFLPFLVALSFAAGALLPKFFLKPPTIERQPSGADNLPALAPIQCRNCGGSVPLRLSGMCCPSCGAAANAPADWLKTMSLREKTAKLLERAERLWARARIVSSAPVRAGLWLLVPVLLVLVGVGLFSRIGDALFAIKLSTSFVAAAAFLGGLSLAGALMGYALYLGSVNELLPVETAAPVEKAEAGQCTTCAGGIEHRGRALSCLCGYCGTENYRAALASREVGQAGEEKSRASVSLYDAMRNIVELRDQACTALATAAMVVGGLTLGALVLL